MTTSGLKYLGMAEAKQLDVDLMSAEQGFSIDQLMELAGLSVASAIQRLYPVTRHKHPVLICGPGNNGGDGLVAARHLHHFGYSPSVWYPKPTKGDLYQRLVKQCQALNIPVLLDSSDFKWDGMTLAVDAIFGFSFDAKGDIRAPFDSIIKELVAAQKKGVSIVSIDIPSSWDVESGDIKKLGLLPETLVSLTAPKLCARYFTGKHHVLGGRFVTPAISEKYQLNLPAYPGSEQFLELPTGKL